MDTYRAIGIMSGTSLDGLDIALCEFTKNSIGNWSFNIIHTQTKPYRDEIKDELKNSMNYSGLNLMLLNNKFGNLIGQSVNQFIHKFELDKKDLDFISSHGHTIFHQPDKNLTTQIGNGANISAITKITTICDFRSIDLALNGNGAPLVPIGDKYLFAEFDYCLNLGGIANVSFNNNQTIAFDICPTNIILNKLVNSIGIDFDDNGEIARTGSINQLLLHELNDLGYYKNLPPKSLGIEWINSEVHPIIDKYNLDLKDNLRTCIEHIAIQISSVIRSPYGKTLITGGGAYNSFLIERLKALSPCEFIIPSSEIIEFKEALIFAFLGVLRFRNEINCLSTVTGANHNNIGGCIYKAF